MAKKKWKKKSTKDIKARRKKLKKKAKKAAKKGKVKKVQKIQKRRKAMRKEVVKRKTKKAVKADEQFFDTGMSIQDIYESEDFSQLSPSNQELIKEFVDSYSPEEIKDLKLSTLEKKAIKKRAKKWAEEKYGKKSRQYKELDQDYEVTLASDIERLRKEQERAEEDLQYALDQNDQATAESLKAYQRTLQDSIGTAKTQYETVVKNKKDYLENKLKLMQEKLESEIGYSTEGEQAALRTLERDYTKNIRDLQTNMASMGYAFSGDRVVQEGELEEETEEMKTTTSRDAEQERKRLEETYGTGAQEWETRLTADEIETLTREYGEDIRGAIQEAEAAMGTDAVRGLIESGQAGYLVGDQRGSVNVKSEATRRSEETGYQRGAEGRGSYMEQFYGSGVKGESAGIGRGYNSAFATVSGGVYDPTGIYGKYGSAGRDYRRTKKDYAQTQRDKQQDMYEQLRNRSLEQQL